MPPRVRKTTPENAAAKIETELQAATEVDAAAMPIDVLGDWYTKLIEIRARMEVDAVDEKEAKGKIQELLEANDKSVGLIDGQPVIEISTTAYRNAPNLGKLDIVAAEIGVQTSKLIGDLFDSLGITAGFPVESLSTVLQVAARKVLTEYTTVKDRTTVETKKFLEKTSQE